MAANLTNRSDWTWEVPFREVDQADSGWATAHPEVMRDWPWPSSISPRSPHLTRKNGSVPAHGMGQSIGARHEHLLDLPASADDMSQRGIRHLGHEEACILIQARLNSLPIGGCQTRRPRWSHPWALRYFTARRSTPNGSVPMHSSSALKTCVTRKYLLGGRGWRFAKSSRRTVKYRRLTGPRLIASMRIASASAI